MLAGSVRYKYSYLIDGDGRCAAPLKTDYTIGFYVKAHFCFVIWVNLNAFLASGNQTASSRDLSLQDGSESDKRLGREGAVALHVGQSFVFCRPNFVALLRSEAKYRCINYYILHALALGCVLAVLGWYVPCLALHCCDSMCVDALGSAGSGLLFVDVPACGWRHSARGCAWALLGCLWLRFGCAGASGRGRAHWLWRGVPCV